MERGMVEDFSFLPAWKLSQLMRNKEVSPVEVMTWCLEKISKLNPQLNMFIDVMDKTDALREAKLIEKKILRNEFPGFLSGIPLPVKDLTPTKYFRTTYGSLIKNEDISSVDLAHISQLKHSGAIVIGKTNTSEFGHKTLTENRLLDPCRNPWNFSYVSGGSSGGSAVAVASGIASIAEGSDGGGSIRIPASFCGVYGIKPTNWIKGKSTKRKINLRDFLQYGFLARDARDLKVLFEKVFQNDISDHDCHINDPILLDSRYENLRSLKIAWIPDWGVSPLDSQIRADLENSVLAIEKFGASVDRFDYVFDELECRYAFATLFFRGLAFEYGSLLDRFRNEMTQSMIECLEFGREITDGEYIQAIEIMDSCRDKIRSIFDHYDLILTPTTPISAFEINSPPNEIDGILVDANWAFNTYCYIFNMTGNPAVSIPCGRTKELPVMPFGLQAAARMGEEKPLIDFSIFLESAWKLSENKPFEIL
jgi:Asp-tRNA(Asn)/Glu-tRNA(Gln) amidotransferase A subunit family amidase